MVTQPAEDSSHQPAEVTADAGDAEDTQSSEQIPSSQTGTPGVVTRIWYALQDLWQIALLVGLLLGGAAAAYVWWSCVPEYQSTATLLLRARQPYIVASVRSGAAPGLGTQLQMIKMRSVLTIAQENLGGVDEIKELRDPANWINDGLTISRIPDSELYKVGFRHTDPVQAQLVVEEVLKAYMSFSRKSEEMQARSLIQLLEKEERKQQTKIASLREDLRQKKSELTANDPYAPSIARPRVAPLLRILRQKDSELTANDPYAPSTGRPRVVQSPAGALMEKLTNVEVEEKMTQVELAVLRETADADPQVVELPPTTVERIESYPEVERLRWLIILRKLQLADSDAKVIGEAEANTNEGIQRDLEKAEEALQEVRQQLAEELRQAAVAKVQREREGQVQEREKKLELLAANRIALQSKLDEERLRMQVPRGDPIELEFKQAELEREQQIHRLISQRRMDLLTELDAPSRVSLVESANLPTEPVEGRPTLRTLFAGLAGLLLPFGLVVACGLIRP